MIALPLILPLALACPLQEAASDEAEDAASEIVEISTPDGTSITIDDPTATEVLVIVAIAAILGLGVRKARRSQKSG